MGRKSKSKDRGYLTATEWREEGGGFKQASVTDFRRLPYHCCAISFLPFEDAACTHDGTTYDIVNIVEYIRKFKRHPISGEPLSLKDVVPLHFAKNNEGEYHCPVLHKVFTESTHIVAIRPTGNVFCFEAVEELNIKPRFWKDLLTDQTFSRKDIIHLQDPTNLAKHNMSQFDHVKKDIRLISDEERAALEKDPSHHINTTSEDAQRVMSSLTATTSGTALQAGGGGAKAQALNLLMDAKRAAATAAAGGKDGGDLPGRGAAKAAAGGVEAGGPDPRLRAPERTVVSAAYKPGTSTWNTDDPDQQPWLKHRKKKGRTGDGVIAEAATGATQPLPFQSSAKLVQRQMTTGAASRSFTSTSQRVVTVNERITEREERCPKKKAYLRLSTSLGDLNLELHSDMVPRAAENFLVLAQNGYYNGTVFHRSIRNFMAQGGDPTGTGTGGQSIYGGNFRDEFDNRLTHSGRGILSMANSGPHSNGSQFFILYKSAHHLDHKHTVFGKVVGGLGTITEMERVPVNDEDRPLKEIKITGCQVFVDPFKEMVEAEAKADAEAAKKAEEELNPPEPENVGAWFSNPGGRSEAANGTQVRTEVGKYLPAIPERGGPARGSAPTRVATPDSITDEKRIPAEKHALAAKRKAVASAINFDSW